jgi:hypothetical protein
MLSTLSVFHSDKWRLSFSKIPTVTNINDLALFDNFAKSITIPDFTIDMDMTFELLGFQIQEPVAHKINKDLPNLSIEFKLVENFMNYYRLWQWIYNIKTGQNIPKNTHLKDYNCSINLEMLNNMKKTILTFHYTKCFCLSLSSLALTSGTGEEMTFSAEFSHEQVLLEYNPNYECTI